MITPLRYPRRSGRGHPQALTILPGPRPENEPTHHGDFEPERVYLKGDTVDTDEGRYRALADLKSGHLPPPLVFRDRPGELWEPCDPSEEP